MAPRNGPGADHLTHLDKLRAAPEKHHIFHAFRILEGAFPDAPRIGNSRRPREDKVRFGQKPELSFAPSTVAAFEPPAGDKPGKLTNRFFGLFGPQGPLPLHMTEYARARERHFKDPTLVSFADMVTHRLMTLLFRAWRSGQPAASFDRGDNDAFERKVSAFSGYYNDNMRGRDALPDLAKRHFTGLLSQGPRNAEGLVSIVSAFFDAPVKVEQFVGSWLELEPDDRWQLGGPASLGKNTSIGEKVWTRGAKFRLVIGPVGIAEYERLLPGGASFPKLQAIVRNYAGDALDWDVNLILKADDVPSAQLGQTTRLGQTSWVGTRKNNNDAADLMLEANAITDVHTDSEGKIL